VTTPTAGREERRPGGAMITVTERAAARLQELQSTRDVPPGQGVKFVPRGPGSVGLTIGAPEAGDAVVRYAEAPVLIVDGRLTAALEGAELDCEEAVVAGQPRPEYTIRRPAPPGPPGGPAGQGG
jgi:Fe-S cluster assembly iron-binding protein IscA